MRSRQYAQIGALLAQSPKVREALLLLAARHNMRQQNADEVAAGLLARLLHRANELTEGRLLNKGTVAALDALTEDLEFVGHSIKEPGRPQTRAARKNRDSATDNQTAGTGRRRQPKIRYRSVLD
jgi:hypothetical protein